MHRMLFSWVYMLALSRFLFTFSFAAFKRYNITKHHRRSLSGLNSQHQGNCRSAHHGFTTSISITIRGVFWGVFLIFVFWGHQKASCISGYALETWDYGLTALSKHYFHNCSLFLFHVHNFSMLLVYCQCRQ